MTEKIDYREKVRSEAETLAADAATDGGRAFPTYWDHGQRGMSLRDYFAAQALPEVLSLESTLTMDEAARLAYAAADAMLKARST